MWILTVCLGWAWGMCNQLHYYTYDNYEICMEQRKIIAASEHTTWAICKPKQAATEQKE